MLLAGFAQDYAIRTLIGHSEIGKQVLASYREVWQNVTKASPAGTAPFPLFAKRCLEYVKAARQNEEGAKESAMPINRIALIFGGHIQPETGTPTQKGTADMLAMTYADVYYFSHFEGAAQALRKIGVMSER